MQHHGPFEVHGGTLTAFCSLREELLLAEVLALPRKEGMFVLDTDASNVSKGEILTGTSWELEANSFHQ